MTVVADICTNKKRLPLLSQGEANFMRLFLAQRQNLSDLVEHRTLAGVLE